MEPTVIEGAAPTLLDQIMAVWINPEIEHRRETGELDTGFVLRSAQVIVRSDGRTDIRLNNEVIGTMFVKFSGGRVINVGDPVYPKDIAEFGKMHLLSSDDPDAGHITVMHVANTWYVAWDCRYNAGHAGRHLEAAAEFINSARDAYRRGESRALAENLFGAAELCVKARMMLMPRQDILESRSHKQIRVEFEKFAELNADEQPYADLLNRLQAMRVSARYLRAEHTLSTGEQSDLLSLTTSLRERVVAMLPERRDPPR